MNGVEFTKIFFNIQETLQFMELVNIRRNTNDTSMEKVKLSQSLSEIHFCVNVMNYTSIGTSW